jgi:hypothetical protein
MNKIVNIYLKNIYNKGFSIERDDNKRKSFLLTKNRFTEVLTIILPDISDSAIKLLVKEVIDRGSRTIKAYKLILDGIDIWDGIDTTPPDDDTGGGGDIVKNLGNNFRIRARAFFQGTRGDYYLMTVDEDGANRWIKDDPNRYPNVFIFEQPIFPIPPQEGF